MSRRTLRRTLVLLVVCAIASIPATPQGVADSEERDFTGEAEAYAMRVEYNLPIPAGTGTVAQVDGEVRGGPLGQTARGIAGAPTRMDAVVAGTYEDPLSDSDEPLEPLEEALKGNRLPQSECVYPGDLVDVATAYPTDTREEVASLPPVSYSWAVCSPGPRSHLRAWVSSVGREGMPTEPLGAAVTTGEVSSEALLEPVDGHMRSRVHVRAHDISVLDGTVRIATLSLDGESFAEGPGGLADTHTSLDLVDVEAGGRTFSISDDQLVVDGQEIALGTSEARSFFQNLNGVLEGQGCRLTVLGAPERYPQGFLFRRPSPDVGTSEDGTFAASMKGGLLLICDIPDELASPTGFSPQRLQVLFGFAYTMARTEQAPGGFGNGFDDPAVPTAEVAAEDAVAAPTGTATDDVPVTATEPVDDPGPPADEDRAFVEEVSGFTPLGTGTRIALFAIGGLLLVGTAHLAARRLQEVFGAP